MNVTKEDVLVSQAEKGSGTAEEEKDTSSEVRAEGSYTGKSLLESGNLDKIRDILFGVQARAYEQRFTRMEDQLASEIADLREEARKRSDSLENYIKEEVQSLGERLKSEQDDRNRLAGEVSQQFKEVEEKLSKLGDRLTELHRDLNSRILEQSKELRNELQESREQILALLKKNVGELRFDKVDHNVLSSLFSEMGLRLDKKPETGSGQETKDSDNE